MCLLCNMNISTLEYIQEAIPNITIDMRYAGKYNFTGDVVYKFGEKAALQKEALDMLKIAQIFLINLYPELSLVVWDAARPEYAQYYLWEWVKDTPNHIYIADPAEGSLHTYGMAVDVTLCDSAGELLDMGTPFDHFGRQSHPEYEPILLQDNSLSHHQLANRLLLRYIMVHAGFIPIPHEWWHFNASTLEQAKSRYSKIVRV